MHAGSHHQWFEQSLTVGDYCTMKWLQTLCFPVTLLHRLVSYMVHLISTSTSSKANDMQHHSGFATGICQVRKKGLGLTLRCKSKGPGGRSGS